MVEHFQLTNYAYFSLPQDQPCLIRCEAKRYSYTIDADLDLYGVSFPKLEYHYYPIIKRTPKGAWINVYSIPKFVLLSANKKFACETVEQAEKSFKQRKLRQIRILNGQLKRAKEDLSLVNNEEEL
jgi:hypothetical protein